MKAADWIIQRLKEHGIEKVFVVYGAANGDLIDAFTRVEGIDYVAMFHEQACAFAAEGYSKATGKLGCVIVTSGPGGQNLLTGIANCYYDSVPVLFITGQVNTQFMGNGQVRQVGFQENDIVNQVDSVTKFASMVEEIEGLPFELDRAIFTALDGRYGPALLDIPIDIQKGDVK